MTPQERQEFEEMKARLAELEAYVRERKEQQISFPLDKASQDIITNL